MILLLVSCTMRILAHKSTMVVASVALMADRWWKELQGKDTEGEPRCSNMSTRSGPEAERAGTPHFKKTSLKISHECSVQCARARCVAIPCTGLNWVWRL